MSDMTPQLLKLKAICLMLISALSFVLMQVAVRFTSEEISLMEQVFFRNLISMTISFFVLRRKKLPLVGSRAHQPALLARSILGFLGIVLLFYATKYAALMDVNLFSRTSPIWGAIFAVVFLQETPSKIYIPATFMCLAGAYIAMRPTFESRVLPLLCALASAMITGGIQVLLSYLKNREDTFTVVFHFSLISTVAAAVCAFPFSISISLQDLAALLLIGVFATVGQFSMTMAFRLAKVSDIIIYDYAGVVFSAWLGLLLFGETPALSTVIGGGVIVAALLLLIFWDKHRGKAEE